MPPNLRMASPGAKCFTERAKEKILMEFYGSKGPRSILTTETETITP